MSILSYFKPKDGLPNPKGSLSTYLPSQAITLANKEVEKAMSEKACEKGSKRGLYKRYSPSVRAEIGRYTCQHGIAEAAKIQMYLRKVREGGGVVSARIVMAVASGILLSYDRSKLAEFGGHVKLNRHWAYLLLSRMKFVKSKATTAQSKPSIANFARLKEGFLNDVMTVEMEEIPAELILNWDQTGIKIVPSNTWTIDQQGSKRVELVGADDKHLITAVLCGSLVGDFRPVQVICQGKTPCCHPRYQFSLNWDITILVQRGDHDPEVGAGY